MERLDIHVALEVCEIGIESATLVPIVFALSGLPIYVVRPRRLDSSWFGINFCSAVLEFCSFLFHPVFDYCAHVHLVFGCVLSNILGDFDELRRPANLALRVTFDVIYPAAPAQSRVHGHAHHTF
jgi:hypothetical protein